MASKMKYRVEMDNFEYLSNFLQKKSEWFFKNTQVRTDEIYLEDQFGHALVLYPDGTFGVHK